MKRYVGYGLLWMGIFVLAVMWHLPAAFVLKHVPLPQAVTFAEVNGPWWRADGMVHWHQQPAGVVHWRLQGVSWLWGAPRIKVNWQLAQAKLEMVVQLSPEGVNVDNLQGSLPSKILKPLLPEGMEMVADFGTATLHIKHMQGAWQWHTAWPQALEGEGALTSLNVMETPLPDIHWRIQPRKAAQQYAVQGQGEAAWGQLNVAGVVQPQGYRFTLNVTAHPGHHPPTSLTSFLTPTGRHTWQAQWQGRW